MDISTHSTASSSAACGGGGGGNASQQPNNNNNNRKPPTTTSREQSQLVKLREANAKYKNLLKLAKERIQEQEGVLDERRCEYFSYSFFFSDEASSLFFDFVSGAITSVSSSPSSSPVSS